MVKVIMHGCNGRMGQVISGLIAADEEVELVAGVDVSNHISNPYPVFSSISECDVKADVIIDFASAKAVVSPFCPSRWRPCIRPWCNGWR